MVQDLILRLGRQSLDEHHPQVPRRMLRERSAVEIDHLFPVIEVLLDILRLLALREGVKTINTCDFANLACALEPESETSPQLQSVPEFIACQLEPLVVETLGQPSAYPVEQDLGQLVQVIVVHSLSAHFLKRKYLRTLLDIVEDNPPPVIQDRDVIDNPVLPGLIVDGSPFEDPDGVVSLSADAKNTFHWLQWWAP